MRFIPTIVFVLIALSNLRAQDTLTHETSSSISTIRKSLGSDYVLNSKTAVALPTDTLKLPADSLKGKQKLDSVKNLAASQKSKITAVTDSAKRITSLPSDKINQGINSVQSRVDSVTQKINKPGEDVNKKIGKAEGKVQSKITGVGDNIQGKSDRVEGKLQGGLHKATDGEMKIPDNNKDFPVKDLNLQDQDIIPGSEKIAASVPQVDGVIPKLEVPGTDKLKLPDDKLDLKDLGKKTNIDLPEKEKLNEISGEMNKIDGKLGEVEKYEGELKNINENGLEEAEKLPQELEGKAADVAGVKELDIASKKMAEQEALIQRYKDKKLLQEEILRKSKNVANDRLNKFSPEFKDAEAKIAKSRKINPTIDKMKEERKTRVNAMRGKPFRQRFVPGITFQVYNGQRFNTDCAIQAGYRVSGLFTVGAGYTYRVNFGKDNPQWITSEGIAGYRIYADLTLYKNFYIHADFESASLDRKKQNLFSETADLRVTGSYFGLGKRYNVSRKVKGSVSALYRVNYKGEISGLSKINVRIGFDYNLKKQKRQF